jgi:hypothetical protein
VWGDRERREEAAAQPRSGDTLEGMELTCGAHVSMAGEREGGSVKGATQKRKCNPVNVPKACGLAGPVRVVAAYGGRVGRWDGLGQLGRILGEIQIGN